MSEEDYIREITSQEYWAAQALIIKLKEELAQAHKQIIELKEQVARLIKVSAPVGWGDET